MNAATTWDGSAGINAMALANGWWQVALRGAAAVLFGVLTWVFPLASLRGLVLLFGIFCLADGVLDIALSVRDARTGKRWGALLLEGIVSLAAGVVTLFWPGITAVMLVFVIAGWSVVTGVMKISAAVRLRKQIQGEWLLASSGVLSIVFGVGLWLFPGAGALALALWIGTYAIVLGSLLVGLGFRLRQWAREPQARGPGARGPSRPFPTGGFPSTP